MYDRTDDLIKQKFKSYLIPTVLMTMALSLGMVVDALIVSNFIGQSAFVAVNLCTPIILCYNAFFTLIGVGGATTIAIAKGRKDESVADEVFSTAMVLLVIVSITFVILGNLGKEMIVSFLCSNNNTVDANLVRNYLTPTIWGAPFFIIVSGFIPFIRTDGKPKLASNIIIISNVINLSFDYILVKIIGIGIGGAAISSVLGYFIGGFVIIKYWKSKERTLHLCNPKKNFAKHCLNIAGAGSSSALTSGLMFFKNIMLNKIILASLGSMGIAAYSVCSNCLTLATMFIGGTIQTLLPIVGVLYGEEDRRGVKVALKTAITFAIGACLILFVIFQLIPAQISAVFNIKEAEVLKMAVKALRVYTFSLPFYTFNYIMISFYQTTEKKMLAVTITCFQGFLFIVPIVYLLSTMGVGNNLWFGFVISEVLAMALIFILSIAYSRKSKALYKGLLLQKDCSCGDKLIEFSIKNNVEDAVGISYKIMEFCNTNLISNTTAQCAAIAAEEMAINTIMYGYNKDKLNYIDVNVKIIEGIVILRFRDDGVFFNPITFRSEGKEFSGIDVVKKVAKNIQYSRVLGFNTIIIKL